MSNDTPPERIPTVACSRCDREWELTYELEEGAAGNRALEQFALDHHRHTGHYPDDVTPWLARCRRCPAGEEFLAERTQSLVWLGGPVGVYVLLLAVVLTTLATGLTRGLDRELLGYQIGRALCCAAGAYLGAYLLVGTLL